MRHNRLGQTILPEYVVGFFLVIGFVVAITVYVQRAFQAKIYDERNFMVKAASAECDANCLKAAHAEDAGHLPYEYEPYYTEIATNTTRNSVNDSRLLATQGSSGVYRKYIKEHNDANTISIQLPPKDAQ